ELPRRGHGSVRAGTDSPLLRFFHAARGRAESVRGLRWGFGAALFALTIARDVDSRLLMERQVRKIMSMSLAGALVVGYAWLLLLETHAVAGTTDLAQTVTAIPTVLFDTRFGQILVLQALLIVCALAVVWRGLDILAASLAGTAVMLEAGHSHAFAMAHIPLLRRRCCT